MNVFMASGERARLVRQNQDVEISQQSCNTFQTSKVFLVLFLVGTLLVLGIGAVIGVVNYNKYTEVGDGSLATTAVTSPTPASFQRYRFAAVAADAPECSTIGMKMLALGGSAVDSAIAALICLGLMSPQSAGIGGGSFMVIYDRPRNETFGAEKQMKTLDFRETAPEVATVDFYDESHQRDIGSGRYSIAVPGEIRGYHAAWERYGRLPWDTLFEPTIRLCRQGYEFHSSAAASLDSIWDELKDIPSWRNLFVNKATGLRYQAHEQMTNPLLADTLERIAKDPESYYTGDLAKDILADLQEVGSVITAEDLASYKPLWKEPVATKLESLKLKSFSMPPPSSGAIYHFMLKLMEGYKPQPEDIRYLRTAIPAYHRLAETFKFGFAERTYLADPAFVNLTEHLQRWDDHEFIASIRARVDDARTHDVPYYNPASTVTLDGGTTHLSVLAPNGGAVSVTSTVNGGYGSKLRGSRTGIIFNNEMDDFSLPGPADDDGLEPNPYNYPEPGKRPLSSMVPTIVLDEDDDVRLVIGGAGSKRILTATTFTTLHHLWYQQRIDRAIDDARLHHSLSPNSLEHEDWFPADVLRGLSKKGHELTTATQNSVIQAISSTCGRLENAIGVSTCIQAACDGRKDGRPDGF